ncbi:hypothetical protein [Streptomyces sp. NPDC051286]|uniref:hypothetical protein n=1 Tax=Streptomyces sp. NPDC051286 TaxID=3365647 RepID=UPI0037B3EB4B
MTESASAQPRESLPLDSTAQLLTRITAQLGIQLSHVSLNGTRRPPVQRTVRPAPGTTAPALVAVAHGNRDRQALGTAPVRPGAARPGTFRRT